MYLIETYFRLTALENNIESQSSLLNAVIDQWRYNGQIIGREIPLYLAEEDGAQGFAMRVICPEQDSLFPQNNNAEVNRALQAAEKCGVISRSFSTKPKYLCFKSAILFFIEQGIFYDNSIRFYLSEIR